jgi:hypothetical protein
MSLLSDLKTGPKVFRTKIPEEIKIAQKLFRGKILAVDQPVKPQTKIETTPPPAKAVPSRPTDAAPEKSELWHETGLVRPVETPTKIETTPPAAKAVPSQQIDAPPEETEPRRETEPVKPVESQTKIETTLPVEKKAAPSQPTDAPSEKSEPRHETELVRPVETPTKIEKTPLLAQAVPSQPTVAPPEKSGPQQETEPHPPTEPQTKVETILATEEQSVYSQPNVAPSKQRELPEKADLRQAEIRPQPVEEDVIEKTEERIIHSEKWLLSQESSYYTIQLMGARKEVLLFNFVEKNLLLEKNEVAYYQSTFKDKPWFQLLYGVYTTRKDAQSAADNLPPTIRKSSPWIRRLSAVQKTIRGKTAP